VPEKIFTSLSKKFHWEPCDGLSLATAEDYSGISGQIFGIYESVMNALRHNLARLHKSDELASL